MSLFLTSSCLWQSEKKDKTLVLQHALLVFVSTSSQKRKQSTNQTAFLNHVSHRVELNTQRANGARTTKLAKCNSTTPMALSLVNKSGQAARQRQPKARRPNPCQSRRSESPSLQKSSASRTKKHSIFQRRWASTSRACRPRWKKLKLTVFVERPSRTG